MIIEMNMDCKQYLGELTQFFGLPEDEIEEAYDVFPHVERWGGGTVEPAVGQMLYIITKVLEPKCVIELGTNVGYSTYCLAQALYHLGNGCVHTWDIDPAMTMIAGERLTQMTLLGHTDFHIGDSTRDLEPWMERFDVHPELAFIDSSHQYEATLLEIEIIKKYMSKGYIMFHDATYSGSGVTRALDELPEQDKLLRIPTQPNTGFGVLKVG